jgi:20S proteasome alpha/beta subunit
VVAAQGKNFVVLGADSKGMLGDLLGPIVIGSSRAKKVSVLSEHVAAAVYGIAEFGENLRHQFEKAKKSDLDGVTEVLEEFRGFCKAKWKEWFGDLSFDRQPPVGFVIAGLDKNENGEYDMPRIYSIDASLDLAPALHPWRFACMGIPSLATFLMDENYREDMDVDEVANLVESTISRVAQTDPRIGLPVRMALIRPEQGARMIRE